MGCAARVANDARPFSAAACLTRRDVDARVILRTVVIGYNAQQLQRGSSSVGRAIPCQGIGREFETLLPLQYPGESARQHARSFPLLFGRRIEHVQRVPAFAAGWQSGYAAACKAVDAGSIPTPASSLDIFYTKHALTPKFPGGSAMPVGCRAHLFEERARRNGAAEVERFSSHPPRKRAFRMNAS